LKQQPARGANIIPFDLDRLLDLRRRGFIIRRALMVDQIMGETTQIAFDGGYSNFRPPAE